MTTHLLIIVGIMVATGSFGGFLNYLHNFDTLAQDANVKLARAKYILLGIGAALMVPAFLQMISSDLLAGKTNTDYLIFAGFCLIAAIFSRRFITSIGDKILEAAKKAERTAQESKRRLDSTQLELSTARERIEDVKLAFDIHAHEIKPNGTSTATQKEMLLALANNYETKTRVADYLQRIKLKAEMGRRMGEIIVRNQFNVQDLLAENASEGMLLAVANSVQLNPQPQDAETLKAIAKRTAKLFVKHDILVGFDTLARNGFLDKQGVMEVCEIVKGFRKGADDSLLRKITDTMYILDLVNPDVVA